MKTKILIIAYKFPPMGGIGTRRWAKFAKILSRNGYCVHILTTDYMYEDTVNWSHDVNMDDIIVHRVKSGYPIFILKENDNIFFKILRKIIVKLLSSTYFYIDIAQNWAKYMLPKASELIVNEDISNVIVTSPPHTVAYQATYLKIQFPNINLIQDFRDNWNDNVYYEYKNSLKFFWQKEKATYMETFIIQHSDYIINVTKDITTKTVKKYKNYKRKFKTIYNGFDIEDISKNIDYTKNDELIKIVYAGSLSNGRIQAVNIMLDTLLEEKNRYLAEKLKINIYSSYSKDKLNDKYKPLIDKVIFFHDLVSTREIIDIIAKHDYCLSINAPKSPYAFGTKIFDYMMLNKKIIHISADGELSRVLKDLNQLVSEYKFNEIDIIMNKLSNKQTVENEINYEKYNLINLAKEFEKILIKSKCFD